MAQKYHVESPEMNFADSNIIIRMAMPNDTHELCELLNEIIQIGGTTAIENPLTNDEFGDYFLRGDNHICCYAALDELGHLAGFQALEHHSELPDDWADIATFTRMKPKIVGVGTALFAESKNYARRSGIAAINATIRADNEGGLKFYEKMGFKSYSVNTGVPLNNGVRVDRISKRFIVE